MNYLVTGATGGFGGYTIDFLEKMVPTSNIYALVRSEEKGAKLKERGINIRVGDYSDISKMEAALEGIDRLLLVSGAPGNRQEEHKNVIDAAKKSGVSYIAYTSFPKAETNLNPLAVDHKYTEEVIKESGIAHTFLRNNWYLENELPIIDAALKTGKFAYAANEGKVGWALKREYAEVAARALVDAEFPEVLELSGNTVMYAELADALKQVSEKEFTVVKATDEEFIENLTVSGLPQQVAEILLSIQKNIERGDLNVTSKDFEEALGKPLTPLADGIKELL
ncbi:MAG: SDR family oxidoreductase [Enterococcus sp.]